MAGQVAIRATDPWGPPPKQIPPSQRGGYGGAVPGVQDKLQQRRTIDYAGPVLRLVQNRMVVRGPQDEHYIPPTPAGLLEMMPPTGYPQSPVTSLCAKFVHVSTNKRRFPVGVVCWTPDGRRLLTGAQNGEFTLWNGQSFNFDSAVMAHEGNAIRAMTYNHNANWLLTADDTGSVKYWQSNFNHVQVIQAHRESVRALSFSPGDLKFCSCSDDTTVKVWDFKRCTADVTMAGHGSDVKSVHWHPRMAMLASGSKDSLVKLWDPKSGKCLFTIHGHKNAVSCVKWNNNGNWLLSGSRDQLCRVFDIRMMKAAAVMRGQKRDVTSVAWHPHHEELFVSGGADGSLLHWLVGYPQPQAEARGAHEGPVWSLEYHPMGHILCSGSNDCSAKFWCRNRPGEIPRDGGARGHGPVENAQHGTRQQRGQFADEPVEDVAAPTIPGIGAAHHPSTAPAQMSAPHHPNSTQGPPFGAGPPQHPPNNLQGGFVPRQGGPAYNGGPQPPHGNPPQASDQYGPHGGLVGAQGMHHHTTSQGSTGTPSGGVPPPRPPPRMPAPPPGMGIQQPVLGQLVYNTPQPMPMGGGRGVNGPYRGHGGGPVVSGPMMHGPPPGVVAAHHQPGHHPGHGFQNSEYPGNVNAMYSGWQSGGNYVPPPNHPAHKRPRH